MSESGDRELIQRARRRYGSVGAIVASGMLGLDKVLGRKPKEEIPAEWQASGEPGDIDSDGITLAIDDDTQVTSQPARRSQRRAPRRRLQN